MNKAEKVRKIKDHKDYYDSRSMNTLLDAVLADYDLENEDELFKLVQNAYKKGRHEKPSNIRRKFRWDMNFIKKEFCNGEEE